MNKSLIFIPILTSKRSHRSQVGSGPTASYLFCFAKKGNPKKATTLPLAFGFPIEQDKKWESVETRYAQTRHFLYPFSVPHNWQCQKWVKVKNKVETSESEKPVEKYAFVETACFGVGVAFDSVFDFDLPPFETM
ncbi:hypothetical protein [Undibacterium danionis]|uniref:Uncharacterized protein n=1 Tax=Undibacterium danionis TaxID=1812100 RepID=A0ABV6IJP8_9BURK